MGRYTIIGLGTFGSCIAEALYQKGHEVLGIDISKDLVQKTKDTVSHAVEADATDRDTLKDLGVGDSDYAVVSVGDKIDASILITLHLAELGLRNIVVKAVNDNHGKILKKIGASEVVFPEKQMAIRVADRIGHKGVLDQIQLEDGMSILEITTPSFLTGKTLKDSRIRELYHINVIAMKALFPETGRAGLALPKADHVLTEGDVLVIIGSDNHIENFKTQQSG